MAVRGYCAILPLVENLLLGKRIMLNKLPLDMQKQVERGTSILRQGGIVAFPTDTVYGLGAYANMQQAVERDPLPDLQRVGLRFRLVQQFSQRRHALGWIS